MSQLHSDVVLWRSSHDISLQRVVTRPAMAGPDARGGSRDCGVSITMVTHVQVADVATAHWTSSHATHDRRCCLVPLVTHAHGPTAVIKSVTFFVQLPLTNNHLPTTPLSLFKHTFFHNTIPITTPPQHTATLTTNIRLPPAAALARRPLRPSTACTSPSRRCVRGLTDADLRRYADCLQLPPTVRPGRPQG